MNRSLLFTDLDTTRNRMFILLEDGLWEYRLNNKTWRFQDSLSSLALEIEDYEFGYDTVNDKIKLWHRGVGTLYEVDPDTYEITRRDESHVHRNQFSHQPFFRHGTVYAFGGYGYWLWKNYITYFNNDLEEWNIQNVHPQSEVPEPRIPETGIYIPFEDAFYFFGGYIPEDKDRADDQFTRRLEPNDVWKFSFEDDNWTKLGSVPAAYEYYRGSKNRRYGRINKVSGSFYSDSSKIWYIPTASEGRGDLVNFVPVDLKSGKILTPIVLDSGLNSDEFLPANFHFDQRNGKVIIVGLKKITKTDSYPIEIVSFAEDSMLSGIQDRSETSIRSQFLYAGGFILLCFVLLLLYWKRRSRVTVNLDSINKMSDDFKHEDWLNNQEKKMLDVLLKSDTFMETSELEERIWDDIDNYDYRRKLRNETINAINRKFKEHYNTSADLISRIKDPEDNRRFLYGVDEEFIRDR
ncbi:hypothetical protein G3570_07855 [Balneolaceae bacterium YR4-1]|uniref:Kelch motif-containing protein n=1 Tax=Halalkalibaculum roseum TaxID=2709311 RepID=A0A6M1SUR7_9BACT|nr:kelch repeat-containing protein [Halalkalibaculum roseum]NGP76542.1 hypothetical protein [Halalkalibaculum roseum]